MTSSLRYFPEPIKEKIRSLFVESKMKEEVSTETIYNLLFEISPESGFSSGCVYLFEDESSHLIPYLAYGLKRVEEIEPVHISPLTERECQIQKAYDSTTTVFHQDGWTADSKSSYASAFGTLQKVGVLWLEIGRDLRSQPEHYSKERFLIIHILLKELLKLE